MLRRRCAITQWAYQRAGRRALEVDRLAEVVIFQRAGKILRTAIKILRQSCETGPVGFALPNRLELGRTDPGSDSRGREGDLMNHLFPSFSTLVTDWSSTLLDFTCRAERHLSSRWRNLIPQLGDFHLAMPLAKVEYRMRSCQLSRTFVLAYYWQCSKGRLLRLCFQRCGK